MCSQIIFLAAAARSIIQHSPVQTLELLNPEVPCISESGLNLNLGLGIKCPNNFWRFKVVFQKFSKMCSQIIFLAAARHIIS